jgi:hypothetical protein
MTKAKVQTDQGDSENLFTVLGIVDQPEPKNLKDFLLDRYGGFADRRVKDRSRNAPIAIHDKQKRDVPCLFCRLFVTFPDPKIVTFQLDLQNAPQNREIKQLVEQRRGRFSQTDLRANISLPLAPTRKDAAFLRKLARAYRRIVGKNRQENYLDDSWVWVCPRTAGSLERFAAVLTEFVEELSTRKNAPQTPRPPGMLNGAEGPRRRACRPRRAGCCSAPLLLMEQSQSSGPSGHVSVSLRG